MFVLYLVVSGLHYILNKKKKQLISVNLTSWKASLENYVDMDAFFLMFVHSSCFLFFKYSS